MPIRILIVEDEPEVSCLLALGLRRLVEGIHVEVAAHGGEVLERVRQGQRFDLLVTDMMMPVMDGARMLEVLEAEGVVTRVLLLTAVPARELAEVLRRPEVCAYLQKPIDLLVLAQQVRRALELDQA